ncbi:putative oxidoreductase [Annulohypoxylon maeteangense]|uniref:putative oxidoreductase n=1 Tax=Annulohypoxylon maeteangense TaxID=1927788 RepID=UPI002007C4A9|nr:putative oxidoreductase [Annulohypoxylon maeteangense]KAI0888706.1 putative oxidoreductase [Annulohypoxylon maeteangense]
MEEISVCEALIALLGIEKVLVPGSTGYNTSLSSYFSPQAAAVLPACFVTPQTVVDVSTLVKILTSSENGGPHDFAVRGGGHTWFANANSAPGAVTIDMRGLNSIEFSADKSSVSVGAGATWDLIYDKLDPLGLSVAGGRVAGVGVGGLTLGGGISYFGPREGLTCNQAISFEIVLADGSVVEANEKQNADLWWGLRGGSNNFGIVTRINFRTFEQRSLLWSTLTLNPLTEPFEGETPPFYKPILELPTISNALATTITASMSTLAQNSVALQKPQAARYMTATTTFIPTEAMIRATYDAFNSSFSLLEGVAGLMWAANIEPLGVLNLLLKLHYGPVSQKKIIVPNTPLPPQIYKRGGADTNALGLTKQESSLAICLISPAWSDAAHDEQVYSAARSLMSDIEEKAKKLGVYDPYIYLDYAAPWQDVIKGYGEENVKMLQALRKRVDPVGVFTRMVKGGFKIPEES